MPKFRVLIHGQHFEKEIDARRWLCFTGSHVESVGFWTTRFIEADSFDEGAECVLDLVAAEAAAKMRTTERSSIAVDTIDVDEEAFGQLAPGGGFVFYKTEE